MKKLEKMDQVNFLNVVMILARMNPKCQAYDLHPVKGSFISVKSADGAKEYESVCIDDLFYNYMSDRIDTSAAADEIVSRVLAAKEKVQEETPRPQLKDVPTDKIMDIFRRICKDAEEDLDIPDEPEKKPKASKTSAMPKPAPVPSATPAQTARPFQPKADTAYDSMFSALDDEGDEDGSDDISDSETDDNQPSQPDNLPAEPESPTKSLAESAVKTADSAKKSSNPQADMGLMDIMSAALGLPEAGSEEAAAAKAEAEKFDI